MPDSSGARQVTRRELLDIRERQWAPLLRGVSLLAEAEIREVLRSLTPAEQLAGYDEAIRNLAAADIAESVQPPAQGDRSRSPRG